MNGSPPPPPPILGQTWREPQHEPAGRKTLSHLTPLIWTLQRYGGVDIPAEPWVDYTLISPTAIPVPAKTPLSTILKSVTKMDEPEVEGRQ